MHRLGAYGSRARRSRAYYLRIFYVPRRPTRSASVSRRRTISESLLATLCTRSMLLLSPPSLLSLWTALPYPFPFSTLNWNWTGINENGVVYPFFFAGYKATSFFFAQAREKSIYIYIYIYTYFLFYFPRWPRDFFFFFHTISYHKYNSKSNSL